MRLAIIGWIKTVEWLQWYDLSADPNGVLDSDAHQRGSVECLSVTEGEFEVDVAGAVQRPGPARPCATAATVPTPCAASATRPGVPSWW